MKKSRLLLSFLLGLQATTGFAATCTPSEHWFIPKQNINLSHEMFLQNIQPKGIILLGEHHSNTSHHVWQLETIKNLHKREKSLVIGLEMLPRSAQSALDDWVSGKIDKDIFLEQSHWFESWGFSFDDYLPILDYAQQQHIPIVALNISHELLYMVKTKGWENVPIAQREGVSDPARPDTEYVRKLAVSFSNHGPNDEPLDQIAFKRFVQQQLLWDRAMAEALHNANTKYQPALTIGLMGSWHLIDKQGVPYQLNAIGYPLVKTLIPWDENLECDAVNPTFADGIYGLTLRP